MMTSAPEKTASNFENAPGSWVLSVIPTVYHCPSLLTLRRYVEHGFFLGSLYPWVAVIPHRCDEDVCW